jgi:hypothetical protein
MDECLKATLDRLSEGELASIAAGALGAEHAVLMATPSFEELTTPHFDRKTIGIVRASGMARTTRDGALPWSAVGKVSDLSLAPHDGAFTHVEEEAMIYEQRVFAADALRFRPARCYAISRPRPSLRILWLEDLTGAKGTPFDLPTLRTIMRHLGEWNGHHATRQTIVTVPVRRDSFATRWHSAGFAERLEHLPYFADTSAWRPAFAGLAPSIVSELHEAIDALVKRAAALPHSLAFGDLAAGNVFLNGDETVAVD